MSFAFKGISTMQSINCECLIFDSLDLKCFLCHCYVNVLINPVSGEKPIKEGYNCYQFIYFLSKRSFLQLEVEVSINNDILSIGFAGKLMFLFCLTHEELLGSHPFLKQMRNYKSVYITIVFVLHTSKDRPAFSELLVFILYVSQGSLRSSLHPKKTAAALHRPQVGICRI